MELSTLVICLRISSSAMFFIKLSLVMQIRAGISGLSSFHGKRWRWVPTMFCDSCVFSRFHYEWLSVTLWTVAWQAPLSMGFSRQKYWSELPCPSPGDLHDPGIKPASLVSPASAGGFFTTRATWEAQEMVKWDREPRLPPASRSSWVSPSAGCQQPPYICDHPTGLVLMGLSYKEVHTAPSYKS